MASADGYGAKEFPTKELETAIKPGSSLRRKPQSAPGEVAGVGLHGLRSVYFFHN